MNITKTKRFANNFLIASKNFGIGILCLTVIGGTIFLIYKNNFFGIKNVECSTQYGSCTFQLNETFSQLVGKNLLTLGRGDVGILIKDKEGIKHFSTKKKLPGTLVIYLELRKPRVAISAGDKLILTDLVGEKISETDESTLPSLKIEENLEDIEKGQLQWAIQTLVNLDAVGINGQSELKKGQLIFNFPGTQIIIPKNKDPKLVAGSLHFMMGRFTMEGKQPAKIDLRFQNPIVIF